VGEQSGLDATMPGDLGPTATLPAVKTRLDGSAPSSDAGPEPTVLAGADDTAPSQSNSGVTSPELALTPGLRVRQYEVIRELGRGGMGRVVLARDTKLGRRVAMKFLTSSSRHLTERFLIEARTTAQLIHPNIVVIHEVDEIAGAPYMVLEYLEGVPLRRQLGAPLPPRRAVELVVPIVRALVLAHEAGVVHRDLKPENVFVTSAGMIKVLDFGIAKIVDESPSSPAGRIRRASLDEKSGDIGLTAAGSLVGTLPYMSPEQMHGHDVDAQSDVWAVGIMLYEMVTGQHPISLTNAALLMGRVPDLTEPMPSVHDAAPDLPERLERAIDRCLRKNRAERFASAKDLLDELEPLLPSRPGRQLRDDESPFPGLSAFQEQDADRFFGRSSDVARVLVSLRERPLVGIVGPSGAGKSSFIRAGVVPALKDSGETWQVQVLRPGRAPLASLLTALGELGSLDGDTPADAREAQLARLANEPGTLGTQLRERAARRKTNILLFVDQFEELYTLVADPTERLAFTRCLLAVADDAASPIRVVVSMRSDFLDRAVEDRRFLDELTRGLVFLEPLGAAAMREVLVQPLAMHGYRFDDTTIVDEMVSTLASAPGALPLLQFAAATLWETRDRSAKRVTRSAYTAMGGISGALSTHADAVLSALPSHSQRLARVLFERLVTPERTRTVVELSELRALGEDAAEVEHLVDHLVSARLLVVQSQGESATVELVHEALIAGWPTLRRWLDEGQDDATHLAQLRTAAAQWEQRGRPPGLLWRGEALADARAWRARYRGKLPPRESDYIDAVFALGDRATRVRRNVVISIITVLSIAVAGSVIAIVQIRNAEQQASARADEARRAKQDVEREAARARAQTERAEESLAKMKAAQSEREAAQSVASERGKTIELTKEQLEAALAVAERETKAAKEQERKARDAARLAEEATERERKATEEARALYLKEKSRADAAEKQRAKITNELPK